MPDISIDLTREDIWWLITQTWQLFTYAPLPFVLLVFTILLLLALIFPQRAQKSLGWLTRSTLGAIRFFQKSTIKNEIEGTINSYVLRLSNELTDFPRISANVEFIRTGDREAILRRGLVILRIHDLKDQNKNIAAATHLFVKTSLLPEVKKYLSKPQIIAIENIITMRLIEREQRWALSAYWDDIYSKYVACDQRAVKIFEKLKQMEYHEQFFSNIFLQEMAFLGRRSRFITNQNTVINEVNDLIDYLYTISQRQRHQDVPLEFVRRNIKTAFVMVARIAPIRLEEIERYVRRVERNARDGAESIYLLAWEPAFTFFEKVCGALSRQTYLRKVFLRKYIGWETAANGSVGKGQRYLALFRASHAESLNEPDGC